MNFKMNFKKQHLFIIGINLVVCITSIVVASFIFKPSYSLNEDKTTVKAASDFDNIKQVYFDMDDMAVTEKTKIDIANKKYDKNITVLDSKFKISDDLLQKINNNIKDYGVATSFYIVSLKDGMSVAYNIDRTFESASSVKAPYALYIYKEIAKGNIDGQKKITYEKKYKVKGTGVIQYEDFGTEFTVKDLVYHSLNDSDNIAHTMLHRNFGAQNYNQMLRDLGAKSGFLTAGNQWSLISARSAAIIWQEIYNFSLDSEDGIELLNILSNSKYNYFHEVMPDIPSASKTGFANYDVVETGIVFDDYPYIAIAIANKGGKIGAYSEVLKLINYMNDIMNEYENFLNKKN